ncbi:DUF948 domain-containing protein [Solibacillus sp. FSL K6-1781]|uniref:Uncharacterized protein containing a divergent version of the methyl-accepting chemotaxis-like domain n=1 Tax=Solibacillus silvestris (strain StLB046) TaxID=1002809 RepID=F2F5H4_SOLSS|nr:DUF948 domain-containing protein [Solibacillus silvestris]BAK14757.1 uncharacterized protein containing a divergent version of the methyl-accepting chemotaxis-like domain [Solibacillus silvestris StLB046]
MNPWFLAALVILGIAVVLLIVCIVAVIGPIKKVVTLLLAHAEGMKKQLNPIQTETTKLTTTVDRMKADIEFKKESVQSVIQSIKHTGDVLNQVSDVSHDATAKVMKKANNDPNRQAEVERWTNTAMGIIQRKA